MKDHALLDDNNDWEKADFLTIFNSKFTRFILSHLSQNSLEYIFRNIYQTVVRSNQENTVELKHRPKDFRSCKIILSFSSRIFFFSFSLKYTMWYVYFSLCFNCYFDCLNYIYMYVLCSVLWDLPLFWSK